MASFRKRRSPPCCAATRIPACEASRSCIAGSGTDSAGPTSMIACARGNKPSTKFMASPSMHDRSEEHTSELQSQSNLVCRLLLEKKKKEYIVLLTNHTL